MSETRQPNKNGLVNEKTTTSDEKFSAKLGAAWALVEKSRHPQRPYTLDYLARLFIDFEELRGDRLFGEDPALVCGMGTLKKLPHEKVARSVFFMGHHKGRGTEQKIERNFGMARPEGYRKACRVMELAERFNKPIVTLIDTPGAYPGVGAEERGQSEAIATSILEIFKVKSPTVGIVIGEGGSGGALAIGVVDRLLMLENSTYSVISPESCAAILWGNASESKKAALALKLGARDVYRLGLCDEVVAEPGSGAHENLDAISQSMLERISFHLSDLEKIPEQERLKRRYDKYRTIDSKQHGQ